MTFDITLESLKEEQFVEIAVQQVFAMVRADIKPTVGDTILTPLAENLGISSSRRIELMHKAVIPILKRALDDIAESL